MTNENAADFELVLKGVKMDSKTKQFEPVVMLYLHKNKEGDEDKNYLHGWVKGEENPEPIVAHMNKREDTTKPNFLSITAPVECPEGTGWQDIGFGNAINSRKDGKAVYHDEILLSIKGQTFNVRVEPTVSEELHKKLGFTSPRVERPTIVEEPQDKSKDKSTNKTQNKSTSKTNKPKV